MTNNTYTVRNMGSVLLKILEGNIFAASVAVNMFSMTLFLIILTFIGQPTLAADVGIVQGATLAVFMAFSANARNLILSSKTLSIVKQQFTLRFYLLIPLSLIAYLLSKDIVDVSVTIIGLLILRRGSEWIAELQISERELNKDLPFAKRFLFIQIISLLLLIASLGFEDDRFFKIMLMVWAIAPALQILPFVFRIVSVKNGGHETTLKGFMPHLGSSWAIAISVYVFRILIVLLAGRDTGGMLFSAFAIGGMLNSVYTYALGPSLMLNKSEKEFVPKSMWLTVLTLAAIGSSFVAHSYLSSSMDFEASFFLQSIGFSLVGGGIMILAQLHRIHMLQIQKASVFVPDVLSNILLVATIPFAFFIFGAEILSMIFLWSAILCYVFYSLSTDHSQYQTWIERLTLFNIENRQWVQSSVLLILFMPIFFQLNGSIFNSPVMIFDSQQILTRVPLPLASIICFIGIALLIDLKRVRISTGILFVFFISMLVTTFIIHGMSDSDLRVGKLILLFQYILPVFALILGQCYQTPQTTGLRFEAIFLYMLVLIVPAEVIATAVQGKGGGLLTPYLYLFSVYQHLQYMPTIFIGGYFLAFASLHEDRNMRILLIILAPFMGVYAVVSYSMLAMAMLIAGFLLTSAISIKTNKFPIFTLLATFLAFISFYLVLSEIQSQSFFMHKFNFFGLSTAPINLIDRLELWKMFFAGSTESLESFVFGHIDRPDISVAPSAHNYYLDLLYNFGFIALLPFLYLITNTLKQFYRSRRYHALQYDLLALSGLVFFFVFIDNSLKVGFRQPYPGIIMFFLWGVLLSRLINLTNNEKADT